LTPSPLPDPLPFKPASIAEELARMKRLFERESVREQEEERVRWWKRHVDVVYSHQLETQYHKYQQIGLIRGGKFKLY
jgi:hypothetical protein